MKPDYHELATSRQRLAGALVTWLPASIISIVLSTLAACCGGGPTHQCHFSDRKDASDDVADAAPAQVLCGREICTPGVSTCCLTTAPFTLGCIPQGSLCPGASRLCDGPEDCPSGNCCANNGGGADCSSICAPQSGNAPICHADSDCPFQAPLCSPSASSAGLRTCAATGSAL